MMDTLGRRALKTNRNQLGVSTRVSMFLLLISGAVGAQDPGQGTLTIAGETHNLQIRYCNSMGAPDTIAANGTATELDGRPILNLNITASDLNGRKEHYVDIAFADKRHFAARILDVGGGWKAVDPYRRNPAGDADGEAVHGPLIQLAGHGITIEGQFLAPDGEVHSGKIEINCPH